MIEQTTHQDPKVNLILDYETDDDGLMVSRVVLRAGPIAWGRWRRHGNVLDLSESTENPTLLGRLEAPPAVAAVLGEMASVLFSGARVSSLMVACLIERALPHLRCLGPDGAAVNMTIFGECALEAVTLH